MSMDSDAMSVYVSTVDDPHAKLRAAVVEFVDDLWTIYATDEVSPLALYRRKLERSTVDEFEEGCIPGIDAFFANPAISTCLSKKTARQLVEGVHIHWGGMKAVHLNVASFFNRAGRGERIPIMSHLAVILRHLPEPDSSDEKAERAAVKAGVLAQIADMSSPEAQLVDEMLAKVTQIAEDGTFEDASSPVEIMARVAQTDLFPSIMGLMGATDGEDEDGVGEAALASADTPGLPERDMKKLMRCMMARVTDFANGDDEGNLDMDFLARLMGQPGAGAADDGSASAALPASSSTI
jgi:hypothetical protein